MNRLQKTIVISLRLCAIIKFGWERATVSKETSIWLWISKERDTGIYILKGRNTGQYISKAKIRGL